MALNSTGFFLNVTLSDQGGNKATLRYDLVAANFTDAQTARTAILALLGAVTDAQVVSYSLGEGFVEDTDFYGSGEIENVGLAVCKLTTDGKTVNVRIPAPVDGIFVAASGPDYNELDPADADLQAYLAIWEAAGYATISDGESVRETSTAGNFWGKRIHRGSRLG